MRTEDIVKAVNDLDINAEAGAAFSSVEVTFHCPMGSVQMFAVFHGDADPERVATICRAIRQSINATTI